MDGRSSTISRRQSAKVTPEKVSFYNRLGINVVAYLYVPKDIDRARKHPAIVVSGPDGAVKEQSAGLYAQTMAERGFVTIAHDPSYNGESGGQPHFTASSEALIEDFSAAVDFPGTKPFVDRDRIGVIGVCGSAASVWRRPNPIRASSPSLRSACMTSGRRIVRD